MEIAKPFISNMEIPWNWETQNPQKWVNRIPSFTSCAALVDGVGTLHDAALDCV